VNIRSRIFPTLALAKIPPWIIPTLALVKIPPRIIPTLALVKIRSYKKKSIYFFLLILISVNKLIKIHFSKTCKMFISTFSIFLFFFIFLFLFYFLAGPSQPGPVPSPSQRPGWVAGTRGSNHACAALPSPRSLLYWIKCAEPKIKGKPYLAIRRRRRQQQFEHSRRILPSSSSQSLLLCSCVSVCWVFYLLSALLFCSYVMIEFWD